jgi:hypothetical protein
METIIAAVINAIIGPIADKVLEWHKDDNKTAISKDQIMADLRKLAFDKATDAYKSGTDAAFKMFDSFHQSLRASREIRFVWKLAVLSQLIFVVYLEMGVPALVQLGYIVSWKVGSLDVWAIGFLGASLGVAPIVLKPPRPPEAPKV